MREAGLGVKGALALTLTQFINWKYPSGGSYFSGVVELSVKFMLGFPRIGCC